MELLIRRETLASVRAQIDPLFERHWREIAHHQDSIKLEPDWQRYEALEREGRLIIHAARRGWALVGYVWFLIGPHLHYKSCIAASNDLVYLVPEERRGMAGVKLIRAADRSCVEAGAHWISWHIKPGWDFSPVLRRIHKGYGLHESCWGRLVPPAGSA